MPSDLSQQSWDPFKACRARGQRPKEGWPGGTRSDHRGQIVGSAVGTKPGLDSSKALSGRVAA